MKTVLVVEDTQDYADCLAHVLSQQGYKVVTAAEGMEGLQKAIAIKPDLILMDLFMPDQDGADVISRIRKQPALANTVIVFLTALSSGTGAEGEGITVDGREYPVISKMADQKEILRKVGQYIYSS